MGVEEWRIEKMKSVVSYLYRHRRRLFVLTLLTTGALSVITLLRTRNSTCVERTRRYSASFGWQRSIHSQPHGTSFYETCGSEVRVLLAVLTTVSNFERRAAIRRTWGDSTYLPGHVKVVFFVGTTLPRNQFLRLNADVLREVNRHGDIALVSHADNYKNLVLKVLKIVQWFHNMCPHARYLWKSDDDVFWNVPRVLLDMKERLHKTMPAILGSVQKNAKVSRTPGSKFYVSIADYADMYYPNYVSGGPGYVMTSAAVERFVPFLYHSMNATSLVRFEDIVITGFIRNLAGVRLVHSDGMHFYRGCLSKAELGKATPDCENVLKHLQGMAQLNTPDLATLWRRLNEEVCLLGEMLSLISSKS